VCAFGLVVGLANYLVMRQTLGHVGSPPDEKPVHMGKLLAVLGVGVLTVFASAYVLAHEEVARIFVYVAAAVVLGIFVWLIGTSERSERAGLIAALVLTVGLVAAVALTLRERRGARYESASRQVRVDPRERVRVVKMEAVRPPSAPAGEGTAGEPKP